ncbi:MAG TPA: hypothetical protein VGJ15_10950 [Pirellulales bacterium]|jgi:hypothetical protein
MNHASQHSLLRFADRRRLLILAIATIVFTITMCSTKLVWAIGLDSIDPDRASSQGVWHGSEIDPQSLRPNFQPSVLSDPGALRMEHYQWDNINPSPLTLPVITPNWIRSQETIVETLPGNRNLQPSQVEGQLAPSTLDEQVTAAPDSTVLTPVDPGAPEMRSLIFGRVDPGRMPDELRGAGGGEGRAAIFARPYETPPEPAGAPTRRSKLGW